MWESPIYRLNKELGSEGDETRYQQIVIDVTGSAPPHPTPGKQLISTLDWAVEQAGVVKRNDTILDFGAGRLRNTLYLLDRGYRATAVEFDQMFQDSEPARKNLAKARRYRTRFDRLLYPHEFERAEPAYRLALLINVINVMPIPAERRLVLQQCHDKLLPGGSLLWYTQRRGDRDYKDRMIPEFAVGDGWFVGRPNKHKTFYREFSQAEIDDLLSDAGFEYTESFVSHASNQVRLYRRLSGESPLAGVITPQAIAAAGVVDDDIPDPETVAPAEVSVPEPLTVGHPDPEQFERSKVLRDGLAEKRPGSAHADDYAVHVRAMVEFVFGSQLGRLELTPRDDGHDIVGRNKGVGFFQTVREGYDISVTKVVTQCRNSAAKLKRADLKNLATPFGTGVGSFGLLAHRGGDRAETMLWCQTLYRDRGIVLLPLDDGDFEQLLEWAGDTEHLGDPSDENGDDDIEDPRIAELLAKRLRSVVRPARGFISYSHEDQRYLEQFKKQLVGKAMVRQGKITFWDDSMLEPGRKWRDEIADAVNTTEVAVLYVSASFLGSRFIEDNELGPFLEAAEEGEVELFPIMVRPTALPDWLEALQFAHDPEKPLSSYRRLADREVVLVDLAEQLDAML